MFSFIGATMRLSDLITEHRRALRVVTEDSEKPTTMSAEDSGQKPDNAVGADDVEKSQPDAPDASAPAPAPSPMGGADGGMGGQSAPPKQNQFRDMITVGKPVEAHKLRKELEDPITQEFVVGELVRVISNADLHEFFNVQSQITTPQPGQWLANVDEDALRVIQTIQRQWQHKGKSTPLLNAVINAVGRHAYTPITMPVERGMRVPFKQLMEFLKPFRIGETVTMPPSGFSTLPSKARLAANTDTPEMVGVLLRLFPTPAGEIAAIQLHKSEVIRPEGPKARCAQVTKFIVMEKRQFVRAYIVVDLEEQGFDDDVLRTEALNHERTIEELYPEFCELMNTSFKAIDNA